MKFNTNHHLLVPDKTLMEVWQRKCILPYFKMVLLKKNFCKTIVQLRVDTLPNLCTKGWDRRSDCTECKIMEPGLEMHYRNCGLQDAIAHNASQCAWVVEMHYRNCGLQDASGSSPCNDASGPSRSAGPRRRGWVVSGERLWCWRYFDFLQKAHFTFHLLPSSDFKVHIVRWQNIPKI